MPDESDGAFSRGVISLQLAVHLRRQFLEMVLLLEPGIFAKTLYPVAGIDR